MARRTLTPEEKEKALKNIRGKGFDAHPENINRKGRPPGARNRGTLLAEMLAALVLDKDGKPVKNPVTGADGMIYEEAIDSALIKKALAGNIEAIKEIKDTLHGKIKEVREIIPPDLDRKAVKDMTDEEAREMYESVLKGG